MNKKKLIDSYASDANSNESNSSKGKTLVTGDILFLSSCLCPGEELFDTLSWILFKLWMNFSYKNLVAFLLPF